MPKVGEVFIQVTADTRQFDRAMRRMGRTVRRTNRAIRRSPLHRRSLHLRGARSTEAWATCYVYVTSIPRALRVYAPGIIRDTLMILGMIFLVLLAIAAYGLYPRR